jgi:hypothetical protein
VCIFFFFSARFVDHDVGRREVLLKKDSYAEGVVLHPTMHKVCLFVQVRLQSAVA